MNSLRLEYIEMLSQVYSLHQLRTMSVGQKVDMRRMFYAGALVVGLKPRQPAIIAQCQEVLASPSIGTESEIIASVECVDSAIKAVLTKQTLN